MDFVYPKYKVFIIGCGNSNPDDIYGMIENNWIQGTAHNVYIKVNNEPYSLDILAAMPQEGSNRLEHQYFKDGDAFILVYSVTSEESFDEAIIMREKILRYKYRKEVEEIPIVLVGK